MLTHKNMHGRVAEAIIYLSKVIYNSPSFTTLLTRQDLADIASLAKESFIRILREFKLKGLVSVEGNSFEIKDMEALEKISLTS
jgi:CRP/FNR family transcriptional regulator